MLRSLAELVAYGALALLLALASLSPTDASAGAGSATIDATTRGRMLFAAMGCAGCHTHVAVPAPSIRVGPDLTSLGERAASRVAGLDAPSYVRQSIREPAAFIAPGYDGVAMPDLRIRDADVDALVAFLLTPR